jgi:hypothetical protein
MNFQDELPPPSDLHRFGSVDTFDTGYSIETYSKSLVGISEMPTHDEDMIEDDDFLDDQDDILEYHYPMVEEADDSSLAARDSLALHGKRDLGGVPAEILRHPAPDDRYRRGRRSLWLAICLLTVALVITLSIAIPQSRSAKDNDNNEAFLDGGLVEDQQDEGPPPGPSAAPSEAPSHTLENTLEFQTLKPKLEQPDLLLDSETPQGKAFQLILSEGLDNPFLITQRFALLVLYFSTGGESWMFNLGWVQPEEYPDECLGQWIGVNGCRMQPDNNRAVSVVDLGKFDARNWYRFFRLELKTNLVMLFSKRQTIWLALCLPKYASSKIWRI